MNTPESTTSGNVHAMPLAALLGNRPDELASIGSSPSVRAEDTMLVGIRTLDEAEKARVRASGVHVFTMKDIDREGIATIADRAIVLVTNSTGGLHVSFDMDVCDLSIAPGVGTPVKRGLNYREAHMIMELVADSGRLLALDLVEVNPTLDLRNATALLAAELALSALGKHILQAPSPSREHRFNFIHHPVHRRHCLGKWFVGRHIDPGILQQIDGVLRRA